MFCWQTVNYNPCYIVQDIRITGHVFDHVLFLYIYAKLVKACSVSQMIEFHGLCYTLLDAFHDELCTMFFIS